MHDFPSQSIHKSGARDYLVRAVQGVKKRYARWSEPLDVQLFKSIQKRDLPEFLDLLECGASANARSVNGDAAIHRAIHSGQSPFIEALVARGIDTNAVNSQGLTAMHVAASRGHAQTCRTLFDNGFDINAASYKGWTPLHCGANNRQMHEFIDLLKRTRLGLDENRRDHLNALANSEVTQTCALLLNMGAKAHSRLQNGKNALHLAASTGNESLCALLLQQGINPLEKCISQRTALEIAREARHHNCANMMNAYIAAQAARAALQEIGVGHKSRMTTP